METKRLILRKYTKEDFSNLKEIISDEETMKFYPKPYDDLGVNRWINWNLDNYNKYGFGLFAVILKNNNEFIGDCGITYQNINNEVKAEIGYHINKKYWNKGYATEAAIKCRDYAFEVLGLNEVYSYMNKLNIASVKVAIHNSMKLYDEYIDGNGEELVVYRITKEEWNKISR